MNIFKKLFFIFILNFLIYADVKVVSQEQSYTTLEINCENYQLSNIKLNKKNYSKLTIPEFGKFDRKGYPSLPSKTLSFISDSELSVEILDAKFDTIKDINIIPSAEYLPAEKGINKQPKIQENEQIYSLNSFYPKSIIQEKQSFTLYSAPIQKLTVCPVRFSPTTRTVIIAKQLTLRIGHSFNASNYNNNISRLKNIVINSSVIRNSQVRELGSILTLTTNELINAAETLALWQRKKGYRTKIIAESVWTTSSIKDTVFNNYSNSSIKPNHLLIIGDHELIPAMLTTVQDTVMTSDHPYVCIEGDDFYPEMTKSRISVSSPDEALIFINKSINYETNPPVKSSFYNQAIASTYFQDINNDNIDDMGFIMPMEQSRDHLLTKGITSERIYYSESTPKYHHPQLYNQEELSEELQDLSLWNGNKNNLINSINEGAFLVYHYDHGWAEGWGDPSFTSSDLPYLTNDTLLPIIFSIDCWVGKFWQNTDCFAEKITTMENGGAVGIAASSYLSLSGYNDALLTGLIDAIWPGLALTGTYMNTSLAANEPIYSMADVLNQGLYRMTESWGNYYCDPKFEQQYKGYHWFGDPTLSIWTKEPQKISANINNYIVENSNEFNVSNLDINTGFVTLYNSANDSIISMSSITSSSVNLLLDPSDYKQGDTLTLTITSHNRIPLVKNINVEFETSTIKTSNTNLKINFINNNLKFHNLKHSFYELSIIDILGRTIYKKHIDTDEESIIINFNELALPKGVLFIKIKANRDRLTKKILNK